MKLMKLFAVLALVGISNAAFGSNFNVQNRTNKPIKVSLKVKGELNSVEAEIPPFNKRNINFSGDVLDNIKLMTPDTQGYVEIREGF